MPVVHISTNINLDGIDLDPFISETTQAVATIIGRPPDLVMVLIKGSVELRFGGNKNPAAFTDLLSMGGITKNVKKQLISSLGYILQTHLSIPTTRFVCNVVDISSNSTSTSRSKL